MIFVKPNYKERWSECSFRFWIHFCSLRDIGLYACYIGIKKHFVSENCIFQLCKLCNGSYFLVILGEATSGIPCCRQ